VADARWPRWDDEGKQQIGPAQLWRQGPLGGAPVWNFRGICILPQLTGKKDLIFAVQRHIEQMGWECPEISSWK
jgi:hypothetical protein